MRYCGTAWHVYTVIIAEFRSFIIMHAAAVAAAAPRGHGGCKTLCPGCAPAVELQ